MTSNSFLHALAALSLSTAATASLANDAHTVETRTPSALTMAMGEVLGQTHPESREQRAHSHGRHAAPHTPRSAAPLVASERPPRPPIAVVKSAGRPEATTSRVGTSHIFPPRGFPKW